MECNLGQNGWFRIPLACVGNSALKTSPRNMLPTLCREMDPECQDGKERCKSWLSPISLCTQSPQESNVNG